MEKKYCINCMEQFDGKLSRCPHCGYEQTAEPFPFGVKPDTILRGRYLVGRVLGQGGFGITYVGYDLTLELKVAIKEYFPTGIVTRNNTVSNQVQWNTVQIDGEQWKRGCESFLKEARRMAKLDSLPGIVRVRDTFPENQTAYIVMDFVEGENLKQKLKKNGVMNLEQCIAMLRPLMESLGEMHRKGLIHRDISPDNIMIRPDGSACLLDFGAAKDITLHQSMSSQQVAKKGFSPLEQYREKGHIGPWTDVYALCATIYYCVTGKLIPDAMDRIYDETVNLDALPGKPFGGAADVLQDGLRIHTEERIQTVEELLDRLGRAAEAGTDADSDFDEQTDSGQEYGNGEETQESGKEVQCPVGDATVQEKGIPEKPAEPEKKKINKKAFGAIAAVAAALILVLILIQTINSPDADRGMASDKEPGQTQPVMASEEELSNVLMKDDQCERSDDDNRFHGTVLGSNISRDSIKSVTFMDTLEEMPDTAWDVSWGQDGTVMAWTQQSTDNNSDNEMYDLFIAAEGGVQGKDCEKLFQGYHSVEKIKFNNCFDTSQVTDMNRMFEYCSSLTKLDVSGFDTSQVTSMEGMFADCSSLTGLDVSGFKTGRATDMSSMFRGCSNLKGLDVSGFDTSQVTDMADMFYSCSSLAELDVSGFDTSRVTNMDGMFADCSSLTGLDVSGFDTSQVTNMAYMFADCGSLAGLDVSGFDTSQVTSMGAMFGSCISLTGLDVSGFDTSQVTSMHAMFGSCISLTGLDVSGFDTSRVTNMDGMFADCSSLTGLDVSGFDTSQVTDMSFMFTGCGVTAKEAGLKNEPEESSDADASDAADAGSERVMTHAQYMEAELDSEVVIEAYVQAKQSWWDNKVTVYARDKDGAYFIYNMTCSEEDSKKLIPGTKIKVTGYKTEWAGEVEVAEGATFEIMDGSYIAEATDVTSLLGTDELINHQNEFVSFKGMTVEAYTKDGVAYDVEGEPCAFVYRDDNSGYDDHGDSDLYFNVSSNGQTYTFCVEYYLCNENSDVYKVVQNLKVGDKIDMEGFLYWWNGVIPHITSVTAAQ